jgi:putative permease
MLFSSSIISNKPLIKVLAFVALIIISFWIASFFPDLVLTLVLSILIAFVLKPLVHILEFRFGFKRWVAVSSVFLSIVVLATLILVVTVPLLTGRIRLMYEQFRIFPFEEKMSIAAKEMAARIPFVNPATIGDKVHIFIEQFVQSIGGAGRTIASYLANLIIVPFITYFILAEGDIGLKKIVERIPNKYFEMSLNIMDKVGKELVFYLRGLMLECSIVGGLSVIGFMIIGIPYALLLGILAGIANLVPYLGFIFAASLAVIASLTKTGDFGMLLQIVVLTGVIRLIDDLILQPRCFGKSLKMHPVAVVLILIIGHQLMGVAGMMISIPVATILRVSAAETYWGLKHYTITA